MNPLLEALVAAVRSVPDCEGINVHAYDTGAPSVTLRMKTDDGTREIAAYLGLDVSTVESESKRWLAGHRYAAVGGISVIIFGPTHKVETVAPDPHTLDSATAQLVDAIGGAS